MSPKILVCANYFSGNERLFRRHITGYGYMAKAVTELIAEEISLDSMLLGRLPFFSKKKGKINYISLMNLGAVKFSIRFVVFFFKYFNIRDAWDSSILESLKEFSNNYDIIHFHGVNSRIYKIIKELVKGKKELKIMVTLHGINSFFSESTASLKSKDAEVNFFKLSKNESNIKIVVLTKKAKELISKKYSLDESKVRVIPNFVREFPKSINSELPLVENLRKQKNLGKIIITYVGNFSFLKNQSDFVKLISNLPLELKRKLFCVLIGSYRNKDSLIEFIKNKNSEGELFHLTGTIPRSSVFQVYRYTDLNILLSKVEGFGMSVLESSFHGVPSVISKNMEISSMLGPEAGVFKLESADNFRDLILKLSKMDSGERNSIRNNVIKNFSSSAIKSQYLKVIYEMQKLSN